MEKEIIYLTADGMKKLKEELDHMRSVERPAISAAIAEARDKGDLSENAEYDAAREAQGMLEMRIAQMEHTLSKARIIDESQDRHQQRCRSSAASSCSTTTSKRKSNTRSYPRTRQTCARGKLAIGTPIAKALLGRKGRRHGRGIGSGGHAQTRNPQHLDLIRRRSARQARRHAAARAASLRSGI